MTMEDVSIAIVTNGRPQSLKRCIRSINRFGSVPHKIVVLDLTKAYTDKPIMDWASDSKLIDIYEECDEKLGISAGYQRVADMCDTNYIFHIDDDIYFDKDDALKAEYDFMLEHPDTGIVSCCWYDTLYKCEREAAMKWVTGQSDGKKSFKKMQVSTQFCKQFNLDVIYGDELLHTMLVNKELVYDNGISWDVDIPAKGDREAFFLRCREKGIKLASLCNIKVIHDPKPYQYGSMTYNPDKDSMKYFYEKYGYWPIANLDKPKFRASKDGKGKWV